MEDLPTLEEIKAILDEYHREKADPHCSFCDGTGSFGWYCPCTKARGALSHELAQKIFDLIKSHHSIQSCNSLH